MKYPFLLFAYYIWNIMCILYEISCLIENGEYILNLWLKKLLENGFVCWYGFRWRLGYNTNAKTFQSAEPIHHIAMLVDKLCPDHRPADTVSKVGWNMTPLKSIAVLTASTTICDANVEPTVYFALVEIMLSVIDILILITYTNVPVNSGITYKQSELMYLYVTLRCSTNVSLAGCIWSSNNSDVFSDGEMNLYVAKTVIAEIKRPIVDNMKGNIWLIHISPS